MRAATRGVKVHILTKPPHSLKAEKLIEGVGGLRILQDVGAKVHTMKHLKLHAKMMLADGKRAIVGSINLAPGSFDGRRELAIETEHAGTVQRLAETAQRDWTVLAQDRPQRRRPAARPAEAPAGSEQAGARRRRRTGAGQAEEAQVEGVSAP